MSIAVGPHAAEDPGVEFAILGPFRAQVSGEWCTPPTRQIARVATMLAGWPGETVEVDRLIEGVWGAKAPTTVRNTLQVHMSHLRRMVGKSVVRSKGDGYLLDLPPEAIDAEQFVEAVHDAARMRRRLHYARAAELLSGGMGLWRGVPFPDVTDADLSARRERLAELRDQAREDLLECRLELCHDQFELADVVAEAKELVARQPFRERGQVLLVRALAAADRSPEASAAFEAASTLIRDRLGLDPGRALVDTHARSLTRDESLLPRSMRSVRLVDEHARGCVLAGGGVERVREAVLDHGGRVVTLIVPAERARAVADEVGRALIDDMPAGAVVVDADAATPESLSQTVAEVRGDVDDGGATSRRAEPLDGMAVVVAGSAPHLGELAASIESREAAVLVVVGPQAIGLGTEVVVWGADQALEPVTARVREDA